MLMGRKKYTVDEMELHEIPTPEATRTHHPVPHGVFATEVEKVIADSGISINRKDYAIFRDGMRMRGIFSLDQWADSARDYRMTVGLRNSHDKSFAAGLVLGTHVMICSNGMFFGESSFRTLHTPKIMSRLPYLINKSFGNILPMQRRMDQSIEIYKNPRTRDTEVHDFLIKSVDRGVIPNSFIPHVLKEYRVPRHDEFVRRMEHSDRVIRTGWTLMNAYSEILKRVNPLTLPTRTNKLHEMLDDLCQVHRLK